MGSGQGWIQSICQRGEYPWVQADIPARGAGPTTRGAQGRNQILAQSRGMFMGRASDINRRDGRVGMHPEPRTRGGKADQELLPT